MEIYKIIYKEFILVDLNNISTIINTYFENPYMVPLIISMLPIAELRLAIPFAFIIQQLDLSKIIIVSILGNFLITMPLYFCIKYFSKILMQYKYLNLLFEWIFNRTRKKGTFIAKYRLYGLILFVGIPLPITGAWTGCIAAYLFNLDIKQTFIGLLLGICLSASIVSIFTTLGYYAIN